MKYFTTILFTMAFPFFVFSQETLNETITHDGIEREYILYIPASYTGDSHIPLVFNFHGYGSDGNAQMWYGDFRSIADTANFIIVHPEGTLFSGNAHWNVGGWTVGSTTDDVGFTEVLLDSLSANYNINLDRVYATGMSNGGYMSFLLACQLSEKIAAIASVTGSMTPETYSDCNPQRPVPVLQIHGTDDSVVPYNGAFWTRSISDAMDYWVVHNNCNTIATTTDLPDTNTTDESTVEHIVYNECNQDANVEHMKVTGGDHTWPGNVFGGSGTNYDIDASFEVWKFFSRYDINGLINTTTGVGELAENYLQVSIYPNPVQSTINIELSNSEQIDYEVFTSLGKRLRTGIINSNHTELDLSNLVQGLYLLKIGNNNYKILKTE